jgi:hypothetical protein
MIGGNEVSIITIPLFKKYNLVHPGCIKKIEWHITVLLPKYLNKGGDIQDINIICFSPKHHFTN